MNSDVLKTTVLFVDDTGWWRRNSPPIIPGINALWVEDIDSAVDQLRKRPVDLLVMELLIADSDVYGDAQAAIQYIRRNWGKPIILFTGAWLPGDELDRDRVTRDLDVSAVILKSARAPEDNLAACLGTFLSPNATGKNRAVYPPLPRSRYAGTGTNQVI